MKSRLMDKWRSLSPAVKASVGFFLASVITSGISYFVTPIYTRLLSTDEYGKVSLFMTWMQVFGIVAMFSLSYGVFNNGMIDHPDKRDEYSFSMLVLSNLITIGFSCILLCIYPFVQKWIKLDYALIIIMCIIFMVQPAYSFWVARQRFEYKYKSTILWAIAIAVLSPSVAVLLILYAPISNIYSRIIGAEGVMMAIYFGFYIYLAKKSHFKVRAKYWKAAILFNLPLIPHYLSTYLLSGSDKIMISNLIGDSFTAYYSVAHSVSTIVTIIWSAANASLIPYTYEKCRQKDYKAISKVTLPLLTIFGVACMLIMMAAPEIVAVMASKDYRQAIYVIPPCIGGVFFQVHYYIYANILYYYKKPLYVCIGSVTSMAVNILLNYFCISKFGYIAAGYTTLASYLLQATIDYIAMRRVCKTKIYNMKYIGLLSLMLAGIAIIGNLLYGDSIYFIIARYAIIAVALVLAIVFRKKIIGLFKSMKNKTQTKTDTVEKENGMNMSFLSRFDFFTGVPDSQLRPLCDYLMDKYGIDPKHHLIAANEGNCVALAAGYHLATGKTPVVYMQNSGEGNIINPLASLLNDKVYAMPCVFIIGWRGEPDVHDEPQHIFQGEVTLKLLETMGVEYFVIDKTVTEQQIEELLDKWQTNLDNGKQVAFVVKKGALSYEHKVEYKNDYTMTREKAIEIITKYTADNPIISTTGKASRELFEIRENGGVGHERDFLTVGSMGHASTIALGVAINKPEKTVWCIDGDGAALMHMGAMALIGANSPKNMKHIVINNDAHETVGGMPTVANKINLLQIAEGCGYKAIYSANDEKSLETALKKAKDNEELTFIEVKCSLGARGDLGRPTTTAIENKTAFMKNLSAE